ncbi:uncharacterized protein LOC118337950 [Morone saxatilis]|uniref:uncharacterized protein LOC118337950 n=1 Tax=Morone saxatilis TaxID=34816 RepID=UPI0015E1CF76|nr:uncharacterized protein LOC118337950 [Morone saxatilis]
MDNPPKRDCTFSVSVFHHTVVLLLLTSCCTGQLQVIGPPRPLVAFIGYDIILPCHLQPAVDAATTTVEWSRPDLKPRFVHVWRSGQELLDDQHPSYKGRTSLFIENLKQGNISLKLSRVKLSDEGTYKCFIPMLNIDSTVELVFAAPNEEAIFIEISCEVGGSLGSAAQSHSVTLHHWKMHYLKDGWLSKPRLGAICALLFHQTAVFLFLTQCCGGQSQMFGPSQPIVAAVGDDIVLPCRLEPAVDVTDQTVEWTRPDLSPRFVHVWRDGVELEAKKHPSYVGRVSLSINKLKHGDISLRLYKVKLSDEGIYRCFIPTLNRESSVKLAVGAVSSLIISFMRTKTDEDINGVILQCESNGWYPVQSLSGSGWMVGGKPPLAGPTETVRGNNLTSDVKHENFNSLMRGKRYTAGDDRKH